MRFREPNRTTIQRDGKSATQSF